MLIDRTAATSERITDWPLGDASRGGEASGKARAIPIGLLLLLLLLVGAPAALVSRPANEPSEAAAHPPSSQLRSLRKHRHLLSHAPDPRTSSQHRHLFVVETIAKDIAVNLAKGALSKIGGESMGWILNQVGLGGDSTKEDLDSIKSELAEQKQILTNIQGGLKQLSAQLEQAVKQIVKVIQDEGDKIRFQNWVTALNNNVATIQRYSDMLRSWANQDPMKDLAAEIQDFRRTILHDVPTPVIAIHQGLMGTPSEEGMISLFARIEFKEASGIDDFASTFYLMYQYYYAYQVLGLQLVVEAYHAADPPLFGMLTEYYNDWAGYITAQTDEYMKRAPRSKQVKVFQADEAGKTIGRFRQMQVSQDRVYFFNNSGFVHARGLDPSASLQSLATGVGFGADFFNTCPIFKLVNESLLVGGCTDKGCTKGIVVQKYDMNLKLLDQVSIPPMRGSGNQESRGFDIVGNRLYVVQYGLISSTSHNTTIQVVDLGGPSSGPMKYKLDESFWLQDSFIPGDFKVVGSDTAVVAMNMGTGVLVMDLKNKKKIGQVSASKGPYKSPSGLSFSMQADAFKFSTQRAYLQVQNTVNGRNDLHVLRSFEYLNSWKYSMAESYKNELVFWQVIETVDNVAYSAGRPFWTNATYVDSKGIYWLDLPNSDPQSFPNGYIAMASAKNGSLFVGGDPFGTVLRLDYAYPIEYPVPLR